MILIELEAHEQLCLAQLGTDPPPTGSHPQVSNPEAYDSDEYRGEEYEQPHSPHVGISQPYEHPYQPPQNEEDEELQRAIAQSMGITIPPSQPAPPPPPPPQAQLNPDVVDPALDPELAHALQLSLQSHQNETGPK